MKTHILLITSLAIFLTAPLFSQKTFYDFTVTDIHGEEYPLAQLAGKKVLVVNTASACGLTPQYEDLQALYKEYGGDEFQIIAFPSNNFKNQEPLDNEEIIEFCSSKFQVTFPLMSKIDVKGDGQHPLYTWLTTAEENGLEDSKVLWNFQKYMIDENGKLVGHVNPQTKPYSKKIVNWIEGKEE